MADIVDDIKSRIDIVDLVSQYVQLKKAGVNYKGLCPFHSEKSPSFIVSSTKQICHCFGCNKGGDVFSFLEEVEGITFAEAMEILAERAGLKIDRDKIKKKASKNEKDDYFRAHDLACKFFQEQLYETSDGKKVLNYLYRRGLNDETIKEFKIGFAPDKYDALFPFLLKKGFTQTVLIKSGLASAKNLASDNIYDKYRARLIFPIFDYFGRICGFGGRALKNDQAPKYLNSPENIIYNKSSVLYGLSHAKKYIKEQNAVVLVEGYFDVAVPYQAGVRNIVATSGTALTKEQVRLIKRLTNEVITCFDTDEAGFEATKRAYYLLQTEGINVRTISGIDKKDPADYVREHGVQFKTVVDEARDYFSFLLDALLIRHKADTTTGRREVIAELLPILATLSPTTRDSFVRELGARLKVNEKFLYEEIASYSLPIGHPARALQEETGKDLHNVKMALSELIIAVLLEYPILFKKGVEFLDENDFDEEAKAVYKALTDQYNSIRKNFENWVFEDETLARYKQKISVLRLYAEDKYKNFSEHAVQEELSKLIDKIKKERKIARLKVLQSKIVEAERSNMQEELLELLKEQKELLLER